MDAALDTKNVFKISPLKSELKALDFRDLKLYLQQELLRRCRFNPSYSLRALAKAIGINHSTLSQIIRGKRPLTEKSIVKICQGMGLSSQETENFLHGLAEMQGPKGESTPTAQQLSMDSYHVLAEWYHVAILKLTELKDFSPEPRWISKRLAVSLNEINAAIERLKRLELITLQEDGGWLVKDNLATPSTDVFGGPEYSLMAEQKSQRQILELAIAALMKTTPISGDHQFVLMALGRDKIKAAKEMVDECVAKLKRLGLGEKGDELVQFTASLFLLTQ